LPGRQSSIDMQGLPHPHTHMTVTKGVYRHICGWAC